MDSDLATIDDLPAGECCGYELKQSAGHLENSGRVIYLKCVTSFQDVCLHNVITFSDTDSFFLSFLNR